MGYDRTSASYAPSQTAAGDLRSQLWTGKRPLEAGAQGQLGRERNNLLRRPSTPKPHTHLAWLILVYAAHTQLPAQRTSQDIAIVFTTRVRLTHSAARSGRSAHGIPLVSPACCGFLSIVIGPIVDVSYPPEDTVNALDGGISACKPVLSPRYPLFNAPSVNFDRRVNIH